MPYCWHTVRRPAREAPSWKSSRFTGFGEGALQKLLGLARRKLLVSPLLEVLAVAEFPVSMVVHLMGRNEPQGNEHVPVRFAFLGVDAFRRWPGTPLRRGAGRRVSQFLRIELYVPFSRVRKVGVPTRLRTIVLTAVSPTRILMTG